MSYTIQLYCTFLLFIAASYLFSPCVSPLYQFFLLTAFSSSLYTQLDQARIRLFLGVSCTTGDGLVPLPLSHHKYKELHAASTLPPGYLSYSFFISLRIFVYFLFLDLNSTSIEHRSLSIHSCEESIKHVGQ